MSKVLTPHSLSPAIYKGVLETPSWKTLLKHRENYMQVPSPALVLGRPRLSDPRLMLYLEADSDKGALDEFLCGTYIMVVGVVYIALPSGMLTASFFDNLLRRPEASES